MNLLAPFAGTVVSVPPGLEQPIRAGTPIVVLEAMKMEHELVAERDGILSRLAVQVGENVQEGQLLAVLTEARRRPGDAATAAAAGRSRPTPTRPRSDETGIEAAEREDLRQVRDRHRLGLDAAAPTPSAAAATGAGAPPGRTSTTSSTRARSSSTGR